LEEKGEIISIDKNSYRWLPADHDLPMIQQWEKSFLVKMAPVGSGNPWTIVVSASFAPYQEALY